MQGLRSKFMKVVVDPLSLGKKNHIMYGVIKYCDRYRLGERLWLHLKPPSVVAFRRLCCASWHCWHATTLSRWRRKQMSRPLDKPRTNVAVFIILSPCGIHFDLVLEEHSLSRSHQMRKIMGKCLSIEPKITCCLKSD